MNPGTLKPADFAGSRVGGFRGEFHPLIRWNSLFFGGLVREFADLTCQRGPLRCIHQGLPQADFWKDGRRCRFPD